MDFKSRIQPRFRWMLVPFLIMTMTPDPMFANSTIKVVTYNIHGGVGTDGNKDLARITHVLKPSLPDVIVLNEVNRFRLGGQQDEKISRAMGPEWKSVFGKTCAKPLSEYGNAILTRLPIENSESWLLSDFPYQERRGILRVTVNKDGHRVHLFAIHMGLNAAMRSRHSGEILDIIKRFNEGYCILLGDLNEQRSLAPGAAISTLAAELDDCGAKYGLGSQVTYPATRPFRRIDFIMADKRLWASSCYVPSHRDARLASDHLPVVAELVLPNGNVFGNKDFLSEFHFFEDFAGVPPGHVPHGWTALQLPTKETYVSGVAVIGNDHAWRQRSTGRTVWQTAETSATIQQNEIIARIKTVTFGGGSWQISLNSCFIRLAHNFGELPHLEIGYDRTIIAKTDLVDSGVDPYDWNVYRFVSRQDGDESGTLALYINNEMIGEVGLNADHAISGLQVMTAGKKSPCEVYVDTLASDHRQSDGIDKPARINSFRYRKIELDDKQPKGWLDWW